MTDLEKPFQSPPPPKYEFSVAQDGKTTAKFASPTRALFATTIAACLMFTLVFSSQYSNALPGWFPTMAMSLFIFLTFAIVLLTTLQSVATFFDFATNRFRRAAISLAGATIGITTLYLLIVFE